VLEGTSKILQMVVLLGDGVEEAPVIAVGVGVEEAEPTQASILARASEKSGEAVFEAEIFA